ncbi:hypothetical protein ACJ41O_012427 [Fusarium nematophilum]
MPVFALASAADDSRNVTVDETARAVDGLSQRRPSQPTTNFQGDLVEAGEMPHAENLPSFGAGCSPGSDPLLFIQSLDFLGSEFDVGESEFLYDSVAGIQQEDASFLWRPEGFVPVEMRNKMPEQQQQQEQDFSSRHEALPTPDGNGRPDHNVHATDDSSGRLPKVLKEMPMSPPRIKIDDNAFHCLQLDTWSRLGQPDAPLPLKSRWEVQVMINGYIDGFHRHLPILHLASMNPTQTPSPLDYRLRRDYLRRSRPPRSHTWEEWIERESMKRLLCSIFINSNLHLILYDVVPGFDTSQDLDVEVLEEERLWNAPSAATWESMRQGVIPCTKSIRDVIADMLSESPDEDDTAEPYYMSGFTALVAVHAVNVHNWHLSQVSRTMRRGMRAAGFTPNAMLQHSLAALTRCHDVLRLSRPNGAEPMWDDPEGPLLFNCEAMLRAAYSRLFTDVSLPQRFTMLCASSEDRKTALREFVAAKQERSALMAKGVAHVLESILVPIKAGYLLVQKTAAFSWSVETAVSAWGCG